MEKAVNGPEKQDQRHITVKKEEDLKVEGRFECSVSYKSPIRGFLCTVCVYVCVVTPQPNSTNPLSTANGGLLLNDKSAKKESMRLQLYKHF